MNLITIKGRLVRDPELKQTPSGVSVASFTVAVDRGYTKQGEEKQVDFFDVVAWRHNGEFISKYFGKGQEIIVRGEMQSRKYTDKNDNKRTAWEIIADKAYFCGSKSDNARSPDVAPPSPAYSSGNANDYTEINDDGDLPF